MGGKVYVVDERFNETYNMSSKEIKEWLDFDIPNWCNEIRFNDRELSAIDDFTNKTVVYKNCFGSWGFPAEM